jgi:ParB family chromosome partitioning protein
MARKHLLSDLVGPKLSAGNSEGNADPDSVVSQYSPRGAIGAVSRSIELLKSQAFSELDPDLIDASLVTDRLDESPEQFEDFARQIKENGQQVPILVRPHPDVEGRYQISYGRRRVRAAKAAGILVKAAVRPLSDEEMVLAQGQENSARQDLSFIERALYAAELEAGGFQRPLIMAALAVDKSGISRLIAAAKQLPADVIRAIGPAPKAGRDRWGEFSVRLERAGALEKVRELLGSDTVRALSSDDRFTRLFDAVAPTKPKSPKAQVWKAEDGTKAARFRQDAKTLTLTIDKEAAPEFSDYLLSALPEIYASFKRTRQ